MRKYSSLVGACLLTVATSLPATSITIKVQKEVLCECLGTYLRISFEVADRMLTNAKVVNSSSSAKCDEWHIKELISSTQSIHPDGVAVTGVVGVAAKDKMMNYDLCMITDEIEFDTYWFAEETLIDLEKINRRSGTGSDLPN